MVQLREREYPARVVIVTVTQYHSINSGQVYTENFCILYNCIRLPRVKQELMLFSLNIDRKAVLCDTVFSSLTISFFPDKIETI